ncbi:uncharacterized protein LOC108683196 [Hyalella azteca]|uniref:Uncharacterized protein LOC108683196 n=1 Tax=Hyalella azteca TaxID=294128 RepID=A0A979FMH5_HYAAZ|nr:uncharacterized protein LOC108683196 [Hyalella azteca]
MSVSRSWQEIRDDHGTRPPSLQQHSLVAAAGKLLVFGGELCMSNDTPLWIYEIKTKTWRKWNPPAGGTGASGQRSLALSPRGQSAPSGRRGHSAVLAGNKMIVYGGFQDLHGSTNEMWTFIVLQEVWQKVCCRGDLPPARHAHTAVLYDGFMWVYGGMTDLQERNDLWKYHVESRTWTVVRARQGPGCLHSHVAAVLRGVMVVFGGERQGELLDELWRFHFSTLIWERLIPSGPKPQPRSQFCAFVAPSHGLKTSRYTSAHSTLGSTSTTSTGGSSYTSGYGSGCSGSIDGGSRFRRDGPGPGGFGGSTIHEREGCPCHDFDSPSDDGDDEIDPNRLRYLIQKNCVNNSQTGNLKLSISKISQLNLSHLGKYYNYSMLSNDSTESVVEDSVASTCDSYGGKLMKSQSIQGLKDKVLRNEESGSMNTLSRDILSVPNFGDVIGPEISHSKEENIFSSASKSRLGNVECLEDLEDDTANVPAHSIHGHLAFRSDPVGRSTDTSISDNLMSFSCTESSHGSQANVNDSSNGCSGSFANPNYVASSESGRNEGGLLSQDYWRKGALDLESVRHKQFAEILRTPPDSGIGLGVEMEGRAPKDVSIKTLEDFVNLDYQKTIYRKSYQPVYPVVGVMEPMFSGSENCGLGSRNTPDGAGGEGRVAEGVGSGGGGTSRVTFGDASQTAPPSRPRVSGERSGGILTSARVNPFLRVEPTSELLGPEVMYIVGGKETGHLTVKRPLSVWKLDFPF